MLFTLILIHLVLPCFGDYTQAAKNDKIKSLPKLVDPESFLSNHFSGYFQISSTKSIHYYFAESENDPINDPLLVWTNGGPGLQTNYYHI